ncbi:hypothetical protein KP509_14G065700 [Ceratopteris richardii]|uniref:Reverse transcriptase Ty1/copia-type domain-containing protein n=1 Tax=Ceratopteris richardii TaxID=49495 RepID=A0A8T2TAQ2_CERRI|nr:hypothetical protein KP509_14G065700 [Ceratopteris richardii]
MTDMGPLQYCLGIQLLQNADTSTISISQSTYIRSLLRKYNMEYCKGVATPLLLLSKYKGVATPLPTTLESVTPTSFDATPTQGFPYAHILGGIRYPVTCTRPDIYFVANYLSRFMQQPTTHHIQLLKRLLRYLQHTKDFALVYRTQSADPSSLSFIGYSDADWGGDKISLQSTSSSLYHFAGAALSWQSKKQDRVTLSSTEAEYVAMTQALKEGMWLEALLEETTLLPRKPLSLFCDNLSAIILAKNFKHSEKTKHIALKLQFIRELVQDESIQLVHVRTQYQWADYLTKSLARAKHEECSVHSGLDIS